VFSVTGYRKAKEWLSKSYEKAAKQTTDSKRPSFSPAAAAWVTLWVAALASALAQVVVAASSAKTSAGKSAGKGAGYSACLNRRVRQNKRAVERCDKLPAVLKLFRLSLIWFIVLLIPVKGIAAVAMIGCGPTQHATSDVVDHAQHEFHEHSKSVRHDMQSAHEAHHGTADRDASKDANRDADANADSDPDASQHAASKLKCSNCAPCCAALVLTPEGPLLTHAAPAERATGVLQAALSDAALKVPQRPPN